MTSAQTVSASSENGVQYRKAKLWQIILVAFNAFNGMAVYFLIGLASYSASIGYGIATMVVGGLLTFTRILMPSPTPSWPLYTTGSIPVSVKSGR